MIYCLHYYHQSGGSLCYENAADVLWMRNGAGADVEEYSGESDADELLCNSSVVMHLGYLLEN